MSHENYLFTFTILDQNQKSYYVKSLVFRLANLNGEFGSALKRQRDREEAVRRIADEFEKVGLGVVIHDVAAGAKLGSNDLDHLARKRRTRINRPSVDQDKINRTIEIAERLPSVALANLGVVGEPRIGQVTLIGRT